MAASAFPPSAVPEVILIYDNQDSDAVSIAHRLRDTAVSHTLTEVTPGMSDADIQQIEARLPQIQVDSLSTSGDSDLHVSLHFSCFLFSIEML